MVNVIAIAAGDCNHNTFTVDAIHLFFLFVNWIIVRQITVDFSTTINFSVRRQ